jgi:hypothetical protein
MVRGLRSTGGLRPRAAGHADPPRVIINSGISPISDLGPLTRQKINLLGYPLAAALTQR